MRVNKTAFAASLLLLVFSCFSLGQTPIIPDSQPAGHAAAPSQAAAPGATAAHSDANVELPGARWIEEHKACVIVFGAVVLFIVLLTAALLVSAGRPSATPYITTLKPSFFFWLGIGYLVLLLAIAAFYVGIMPSRHAPLFLGDVLPIAVPWFGALGAVLISLEGIFAYGQRDWDPKFNYWHIGRPLFGAVLGIVAFFTYVLIVISSGSVPAFLEGKEPSSVPKDYIVYYIVAFLVGYREETFRELIRRVTDLVLKPGTSLPDAPAVTYKQSGVVIANLDFSGVAPQASSTVTIDIENTGKGALQSPIISLDKATASEITTGSDKLTGSTDLKPGEIKSVDVIFAPAAAGTYAGVLYVLGSNLPTPAKLSITGTV